MTAAEIEASGLGWPDRQGGLHQPRRAAVAVAEVVAAGLLVWLAVWLWSSGVVQLTGYTERPDLRFDNYDGAHVGGAIAAATAAAVVLLDAGRQLVLAVRPRHRA